MAITDKNHNQAELELVSAYLKRATRLLKQRAVSKKEHEKSVASVKQAKAAMQAAETGIKTAIATMITAEAKVTQAQLALERTSIFSPINGIVAYINIKEG